MPEVQRDSAAFPIGGAPPRDMRLDLRAAVLLVYVVVGASLIVTSIEPITLLLAGLFAGPEPSDLAFEASARIGIGLAIVGLALIGFLLTGERPARSSMEVARARRVTALAFPAGAGALALVMASAWAAGVAIGGPHGGVTGGGLFALGSALVLLGVMAEELLLRGLLQPVLVRAWGMPGGVLLCALAFTLIHVVGGWGHPVSLLNILLAGIWFGLLAIRSGGLAAPILAHFGYNWTEEMIFGASPNPGVGIFGSAVDVDLVGSAIWGGSVEGLNASLAVSLVLAALIAPLALGLRQRTIAREGGART